MFADYHVHTAFSDDSTYPMERVVQDAAALGMEEICITDHVDYGVKEDWDSGRPIAYRDGDPLANVDYPRYLAEIERLRRVYGDRIRIKAGLECGVQTHTIPLYEALLDRFAFDFIILSVHQVEDKEFWTQDFQRGRTQREYNERYYEEMLALVRRYKRYSVLGHLDLITRYDRAGIYPFEAIRPLVGEILRTVIADGKGIELNTSYHRYGLRDTTPSVEILKLYRSMGGEIITIGSDSHKPEHLGAHIAQGMSLLRELGFRRFCTYEGMEARFHSL